MQSTSTHQEVIRHCMAIPELQAIYIFGSVIDGTAHQNSDVDIAFLAKEKLNNVKRWNLAQEIAIILKKEVDLIDLHNCSEVLKFIVISKGELIFFSDKLYVENFATQTYYLYMDLQELKEKQYLDIQKEKTIYG